MNLQQYKSGDGITTNKEPNRILLSLLATFPFKEPRNRYFLFETHKFAGLEKAVHFSNTSVLEFYVYVEACKDKEAM